MNQAKSKIPVFPRRSVYFEKQSVDRLCGLHCLNNLLQGPYFDPIILSEIGIELDKKERELTGTHAHFNVDDDGNYGVQVLEKALNIYGCEIIPLKKRQAISYAEQNNDMEALIFNSSAHWFAIRKIDGIWFNLDSTNSNPGPEIISDFYLSAFIQGAEDIGFTNFLITKLPRLPPLNDNLYTNLQPYQHLVTIEEIVEAKDLKNAKVKEREEKERQKKEEEDKKFKPFSGHGYTLEEAHVLDADFLEDESDEMKQAMALSLQEFVINTINGLPPEPKEGGFDIRINYNGKIFNRKFNDYDKVNDVVLFAKSQIPTFSHIQLFEPYPRKVFDELDKRVVDAGFSRNQMLICKVIN